LPPHDGKCISPQEPTIYIDLDQKNRLDTISKSGAGTLDKAGPIDQHFVRTLRRRNRPRTARYNATADGRAASRGDAHAE
jgi:hypothetical protein